MPAMMAVPDFAAPESLPLTSEEPAPAFPAEPAWGSFELEPAPSPFSAPAPEPFDREPSFSLEPDPGYQVEAEPVFSLDDGGEQSYALQEDVFGAPSELSFDETPQDRYIPEDLPPASPSAGFDWAAAAAAVPAAEAAFPEPEPLRFEEEPLSPTSPEPMKPVWDAPAGSSLNPSLNPSRFCRSSPPGPLLIRPRSMPPP